MKLIRYDDGHSVPPRYLYKYSVYTAGNPFSDEKSTHLLIKNVLTHTTRHGNHVLGGITNHNMAVHLRDASGTIIGAYTVDVP